LRILSTILLTVAVLGIPGAVVAWGRTSSTFTIEDVVLTGTHMVDKKEARRALEKALTGENLFAVGRDEVLRVLRRQCYVADVAIDRDFPDTLRVRLVEHRPALALLAEGHWFVVSDAGHVVCEAPPKSADGDDAQAADLDEGPDGATESRLPRLKTSAAPKVGTITDDRGVSAALATLAGLPPSLRRQVALVTVSKAMLVTVTMRDDLVVRIGDADRLGDKALALRAVAAAYRKQGVSPSYVDVSLPERPLARPLLEG
jgi:cell division protein FtsQ